MDEGYLRKFFKWFFYSTFAIILLIVLVYMTQDEEDIERLMEMTGVTEKIYDYYDWKQYQDDMIDIKFYGHMDLSFEGDTSGLGLNQHYYKFYMGEMYDHYMKPCPYVNVDNFDLIESNPNVRSLIENAEEREVGQMEMILTIKKAPLMPIYYKLTVIAGTEEEPDVFVKSYMNLGSKRRLNANLEHAINREMMSYAKKFFKMQDNKEWLKWLYTSKYLK